MREACEHHGAWIKRPAIVEVRDKNATLGARDATLHAPHEWHSGELHPDGAPRVGLRETVPLLLVAR